MCEDCYSAVCFEGCPSLRDKLARAVCEVCGEPIYEDQAHYVYDGRHLCGDCAENLSLDELLDLSNMKEVDELLDAIGFRRLA